MTTHPPQASLPCPSLAPPYQWLGGLFGGALVFFLLASHPSAVLPLGVNPDQPWQRLALCALPVLWAGYRWWRSPLAWPSRAWCLLTPLALLLLLLLLPPGATGDAQHFRLPGEFCLGLLGLALLLWAQPRWPTRWWLALLLLQGPALWHGLRSRQMPEEHLTAMAALTVPLAVMWLWSGGQWRAARVASWATGLWAVLVTYALVELAQGAEPDAITLNRNWLASALAALLPWPGWWLGQQAWPVKLRRLGQVLAAGLTLWLVWRCESRGAWLGLLAYAFGWGVARISTAPPNWRRAWPLVLGLALVLLVWLWPRLQEAQARDLRLPMWRTALSLSATAPWLGVGPADFERLYFPRLADSGYHDRWIATERAEHCHLEFLQRAMLWGWPAALAWLALWLPAVILGFRRPPASGVAMAAHFTLTVVMVHACFDKPYIQPPTSILALVALGLCWSHGRPGHFLSGLASTGAPGSAGRLIRVVLVLAILLAAAAGTWRLAQSRWWFRRAMMTRAPAAAEARLGYFLRAARLTPDYPEAHYAAGAHLLQRLQRPVEALPLLEQVSRLNPHYAHLNRLLGRAWLAQGQPARAWPFLLRECQLFPQAVDGWQWLLIGAAEAHRPTWPAEWQAVESRFHQVLRQRRVLMDQFIPLDESWHAVTTSLQQAVPTPAALEACRYLQSHLGMTNLEELPLHQAITAQGLTPWPLPAVIEPLQPADLATWQRWRWRAQQLAELPTALPPEQWLAALAQRLDQHLGPPTAPAQPRAAMPEQVWQTPGAAARDRLILLAWLASARHPSLLVSEPANDYRLLTRLPGGWWQMAAHDAAPSPLPADFRLSPDSQAHYPLLAPEAFHKNLMLHWLLGPGETPPQPAMRPPSVTLIAVAQELHESFGWRGEIHDLLLPDYLAWEPAQQHFSAPAETPPPPPQDRPTP